MYGQVPNWIFLALTSGVLLSGCGSEAAVPTSPVDATPIPIDVAPSDRRYG